MRNKQQEDLYQNIIKISMIDVKRHFKEIYQSVEFGAYIKPRIILYHIYLLQMNN